MDFLLAHHTGKDALSWRGGNPRPKNGTGCSRNARAPDHSNSAKGSKPAPIRISLRLFETACRRDTERPRQLTGMLPPQRMQTPVRGLP